MSPEQARDTGECAYECPFTEDAHPDVAGHPFSQGAAHEERGLDATTVGILVSAIDRLRMEAIAPTQVTDWQAFARESLALTKAREFAATPEAAPVGPRRSPKTLRAVRKMTHAATPEAAHFHTARCLDPVRRSVDCDKADLDRILATPEAAPDAS